MNQARLVRLFLVAAAAAVSAAALSGCGGCHENDLGGDAGSDPDRGDGGREPSVDTAPDPWDGADEADAIDDGEDEASPDIDDDSRRECLRDMDVRLAFRLDGEAIVPTMSVDAPALVVDVQSPDAWNTLVSLEYGTGTEPPQVHELAVEAHPSIPLQVYPGQQVRFRLAAEAEWEFGASAWLAISAQPGDGPETLLVGGIDGDDLGPPASGFWAPLDVSVVDGLCLTHYDFECGIIEPVALRVTHASTGLSILAFPEDYMVGLRVDDLCDYKISVAESILRPPVCPDAPPAWYQALFVFSCE